MTEFLHNVGIGTAGTPDCGAAECHDSENSPGEEAINFTAFSLSVHGKINQDALNTTDLTAGNVTKACWACHNHQSDGVQPPVDAMSTIGDNYLNPAACYDCHNSTQKAFSGVSSAPAVYNHFSNSTNIRAATSQIAPT
jgi:hypothetical protein